MSDSPTPDDGFTAGVRYCYANPDSPECAYLGGYYAYEVSLSANATFLALFSISLIGFLAVFTWRQTGLAFTISMVMGCICEILGYAGRIMSNQNRFSENGFLMQICCLTIGPAFMAAGIYLCLRRIVCALGREGSRISPEMYTRIFIPCDVISLILQAAGGGIASVSSQNDDFDGITLGDNIMIAGLSFQVFTLFSFMVISTDFFVRVHKMRASPTSATSSSRPSSPEDAEAAAEKITRDSKLFKAFLVALAIATVSIFIRSIFRVVELSKGWEGPIMARQDLFIGFEGVCVVVAVLVLNVFHPAICFGEMLEGEGGLGGCCGGRGKGKKGGAKGMEEGAGVLEGRGEKRGVSDGEGSV